MKRNQIKKEIRSIYEKSRILLLKSIKRWKTTKLRCKLHKHFTIKTFSKGDVILLSLIFIYGAIVYTTLLQFVFFVITTNITWLSGKAGLKRMRERMEKTERIIENPYIPISKKYAISVETIHRECDILGRTMERYNLKQGTDPALKELQQIEAENLMKENKEEGGE